MDRPAARRWPPWTAAGLAVMAAGLILLLLDVPGWNTAWFLFAWWGYLAALDGAIARLGGDSFLATRRRELGAMLFWSVPYWFLFEAYNLVLENWYYVFLPRGEAAQGAFAFLAFATVLPACFFHAELLRAAGWFRGLTIRPLRIGPAAEAAVLAFGLACAILPLVRPVEAFWMVWGATFGVPEVINRRLGNPSLIADLEQGRAERWARLLVGGAIAGGVWEGLNYGARTKWIYTVPGFEGAKLFEMPILGFLGFPALAIEAFSAYALLCWLVRGGRSWELRDDAQAGRPGLRHQIAGFFLVLGFSAMTNALPLEPAVQAQRPLLAELEGLEPGDVARLEAARVRSPERLVRSVERGGLAPLAKVSGVAQERLAVAYAHADLALHKGMGAAAAAWLRRVGVRSPQELAAADPEVLHAELASAMRAAGEAPPRLAQVRVWVRAASWAGRRRR